MGSKEQWYASERRDLRRVDCAWVCGLPNGGRWRAQPLSPASNFQSSIHPLILPSLVLSLSPLSQAQQPFHFYATFLQTQVSREFCRPVQINKYPIDPSPNYGDCMRLFYEMYNNSEWWGEWTVGGWDRDFHAMIRWDSCALLLARVDGTLDTVM